MLWVVSPAARAPSGCQRVAAEARQVQHQEQLPVLASAVPVVVCSLRLHQPHPLAHQGASSQRPPGVYCEALVPGQCPCAWGSVMHHSSACWGCGCGCYHLHVTSNQAASMSNCYMSQGPRYLVRRIHVPKHIAVMAHDAGAKHSSVPGHKPRRSCNASWCCVVSAPAAVHLLMACWAESLLVAARSTSPGLPWGMLLLKLQVVLLVLMTLPDASDIASESCEP